MTREFAHRGYAGVAPENTVGAFVAAADVADAVELDVQPSADGDPVVFHDERLDGREGSRGVTDGAGYVWETPTAALESTRVLDTDETVPTLDSVLTALPADTGVDVELKNPGHPGLDYDETLATDERDERRERWTPLVEAVADVLADHPHEVLFSSFFEGALAAARDVAPAVPLGVLFRGDPDAALALARRYDADALHPRGDVVADTDLLGVADAEGYEVNAWTVRTWREADRLRAAGVDGLLADYPALGWE